MTIFLTISPLMRPSLPIIITGFGNCREIHKPYADTNDTISIGVRLSPGFPPIVPRIPLTDLMSDKVLWLNLTGKTIHLNDDGGIASMGYSNHAMDQSGLESPH